ncbi:MAG: helix-turn-helix domain-containing protein [Candidatus Aphodocola sp.]
MQATPKAFRVNKGLSITEAAKLLNIKTSELRSIENFTKIPNNNLLKKCKKYMMLITGTLLLFMTNKKKRKEYKRN